MVDKKILNDSFEKLYNMLIDDNNGFFFYMGTKTPIPAWLDGVFSNGDEFYADAMLLSKFSMMKPSIMFANFFYFNDDGEIVFNLSQIHSFWEYINEISSNAWNKIRTALYAQYSPIENYNMEEDENVGSKISQAVTQGVSTYGYNSTDPVPTGEGESRTTTTGNYNDNKRKLTRHGNIGVTTNQSMITAELTLRKKKLIDIIINEVAGYLTRPAFIGG